MEYNIILISGALEFREAMNGAIFVLSINLSALIGWYLWRVWRLSSDWMKEDGIHTACVLFWLFLIIGLRSGIAWFALYLATAGYVLSRAAESMAASLLVFSGMALIGVTLRATYLFSPMAWHHKVWTLSAALAGCFVLLSQII